MTTLTIRSDSDRKTNLLIKFAEELGLQTTTQDFKELNSLDMATGIGRKATQDELMEYLSRELVAEPIDLETAFSKYLSRNKSADLKLKFLPKQCRLLIVLLIL